MLIEQKVKIRWNPNNKKYYVNKNYIYTKINEEFEVDVHDLSEKSHAYIYLQCDYCGKIYPTRYSNYFLTKNNSPIKKDCCEECKGKKQIESNLFVYGVSNITQLESTRNKMEETNLVRFGVKHAIQNEDIKKKASITYKKRTGYDYPSQNPEVQEKIRNSYYNNGTIKTSSQQIEIYNLLKENNFIVNLNYPFSKCSLDIALFINDKKIDIEYDGSYWHNNSQIKDRKRDEFLKKDSWKILRIKSRRLIPSYENLLEKINDLLNNNKHYVEIILDDWNLSNISKNNNIKEEILNV